MRSESDRVGALSKFAATVHASSSADQLVEGVASSGLTLLAGDSLSICRLDHAHGCMLVIHNAGRLPDWEQPWPSAHTYRLADVPHIRQTAGSPPSAWTGAVDESCTEPGDRELLRRLGKRHALAVPVLTGRTVWGEVYVTRAGGRVPFDPVDLDTATTMSGLLSAGLSRLELLHEMSLLAYTDPLTGLANRRVADDWFDERLASPGPFVPVTVVLCDINGLKRVNDRFGHAAGDELIRQVADHLVVSVGGLAQATVARVGGDEFVVLLDGASPAEVDQLVQCLAAFEILTRPGWPSARPPRRGVRLGRRVRRARPARCYASPTRRSTGTSRPGSCTPRPCRPRRPPSRCCCRPVGCT